MTYFLESRDIDFIYLLHIKQSFWITKTSLKNTKYVSNQDEKLILPTGHSSYGKQLLKFILDEVIEISLTSYSTW